MSLEAVKKSIMSEAEVEVGRIMKEGDKESEKLLEEAKAKAKETEKNSREEAEKEVERLKRENEASLEVEKNSILLQAKSEVIEKAVKIAMDRLRSNLHRSDLSKVIKKAVKQLSATLGNNQFVLVISKKNPTSLKEINCEREYDNIDGFKLRSKDGKVSLDSTTDTIARNYEAKIRNMVSESIFGKERPVLSQHKEKQRPKPKEKKLKIKKKGKKKRR